MILPLFGFVISCVIFSIVGAVVLKVVPSFRLTNINLLIFVAGALPGALFFAHIYGQIFADPNGQLTSGITVLFLFASIVFGGIIGGMCTTLIKDGIRNLFNLDDNNKN